MESQYGSPREMLTDRGSQFYANEGEHKEKGQSEFERFLSEKEIHHILCRVNHPQTVMCLAPWTISSKILLPSLPVIP